MSGEEAARIIRGTQVGFEDLSVYAVQRFEANAKCQAKATIVSTPQGFDTTLRLMSQSEELKEEDHMELDSFIDTLIESLSKRLGAALKSLTALLLIDHNSKVWLADFLDCLVETHHPTTGKPTAKGHPMRDKTPKKLAAKALRVPSANKELRNVGGKEVGLSGKGVVKKVVRRSETSVLRAGALGRRNIGEAIVLEASRSVTVAKGVQTDEHAVDSADKGASSRAEDQKIARNCSSKRCRQRNSLNLYFTEKKPKSYRDSVIHNADKYPGLYLNPMLSSIFNGDERKTSGDFVQISRVLLPISKVCMKYFKDSNERNRYILHTTS